MLLWMATKITAAYERISVGLFNFQPPRCTPRTDALPDDWISRKLKTGEGQNGEVITDASYTAFDGGK